MSKRKNKNNNAASGFSALMRQPVAQLITVAVIAFVVYLIAVGGSGGKNSNGLATEISVEEAYQMYQNGGFVLDVRTQQEWDEYHAPNTTLIPLDQLPARISELPKGKDIVVICRSGNRSQQGRDILSNAGFNATSVRGGLSEWRRKGYPVE